MRRSSLNTHHTSSLTSNSIALLLQGMLGGSRMAFWWINNSGQNTLRGEPAYEAEDGTVFRVLQQAEDYSAMTGLSFGVWLDDYGNPGDPSNPIQLINSFVLHCLYMIPQAKSDFFKMVPSLNQAEQTRFQRMLERAPFISRTFYQDEQTRTDAFTRRFNGAGVRVTGRYGGTRSGGNC